MQTSGKCFLVVTFPSTHEALKFEKVFRGSGLAFQLIPVPRVISSSCGLAARVEEKDGRELVGELDRAGIEFEEVYRLSPERGAKPELIQK